MRIGVDVREIQNGVSTGIGRALFNYLQYVSDVAHKDRYVLFSSKPLPFTFGSKFENHVLTENSTILWDQIKIPLALKKQGLEIYYSPYYKIPLWTTCKRVCSVLDVMYLKFGPYQRELGLGATAYYRTFGREYLERSLKIFTSSHFSKNDIMDVYGIKSRKIEVIPLSISPTYRKESDYKNIEAIKTSFGIWGNYLLYVGNFKLHKNVPSLLRAFRILRDSGVDLKLVLVGPKTHSYQVLVAQAAELGIGSQLVFTGRITEEEKLRALYCGAEVFVLPSLYEGFGLPPLEAMACGTPVVCSNATCLPEVVDDGAVLVDALDPGAIARAVRSLLEDEGLRAQMVTKGMIRATQFNQSSVSRKMFDVFRNLTE
jgi:glycosyltransferase involved in cell wall biosynthesis